jgi:iron complex outermembrane receptor protein
MALFDAWRNVRTIPCTCVTVCAVTIAAAATPAFAQSPNPTAQSQSTAESGELQTVEVVARYQREDLQTTPLAITALSAADLSAHDIVNTTNLGDVVPNLYTRPGDAEEGPTPTISMRGVTAGDYSFEAFPAVGIYVDDVYHSTMVGSVLDLTDIDHIEVKRGPQGTLSGNASIAGSINIFSKTPQGDDTGSFSAAYGSYNLIELKGVFDTALIPDKLFLRISGVSRKQDGYVDQLDFTCEMNRLGTPQLAGSFPTSDNSAYERDCKIGAFGGTDLGAAKMMVRFLATDKLEFNASLSYSKEDDEAPAEVLVNTNPAKNDGFDSVISAQLLAKYGIVYDNRFLPPPGQPYSSYATFCRPLSGICFSNTQGQDSTDGSLRADYSITDDIHLKAIYGYSDYGGYLHQAGDVSPLGYVQGQVFFRIVQETGEIRLTGSSFDHKLDWVAGLFDLEARDHLSGAIDFVTENFTEDDHYRNQSRSGFMHGEYHITDKLSFAGGGRYSWNASTANIDHAGLLQGVIPFTTSASRFDWLTSLSYKFTDTLMGYATIASGSRPPGITTIVNSIYQLQAIPQEELVSYEGGVKSEFLEHRLRVNLTGFYSDYSKRNVTQIQFQCLAQAPPPSPVPLASDCPPGGAINWYTTVSRPATIRGFEFETTAEPIERLLLNLSGGYNHFVDGVTTLGQPGYIAPGNLPMPEWNMTGGVQYGMHYFDGMFTPRVDWVYQSESTFDPESALIAPRPLYTLGGRSTFNAQATFALDNSKWSFLFNVTNLTNKYYLYELFTGSTVALAGVAAPPREFRFTARRAFF